MNSQPTNSSLLHSALLATLLATSGSVLRPASAAYYVWLKDTAHDSSNWPAGYLIPQPTQPEMVDRFNGEEDLSGSDTTFDIKMRTKAGPDTWVYLSPGRFKTRGVRDGRWTSQSASPGFRLQDHSRLVGSGKAGYEGAGGGTTLLLAEANASFGAVVVGAVRYDFYNSDQDYQYTTRSDIWVTDLKVDCNAPALLQADWNDGDGDSDGDRLDHPWYFQGVQLWGIGSVHIERVWVVNAVGNFWRDWLPRYATENFVLCTNTPPGASANNLIQDCTVDNFYNPNGRGTCSAISMNRWDLEGGLIGGIIRNCQVALNSLSTAQPTL